MKRQSGNGTQKSFTEKSWGKQFGRQSFVCVLVLVLVFAIQHTVWSGRVQDQIQRLFAYEIDFSAWGQRIKETVVPLLKEPQSAEPVSAPIAEERPRQDVKSAEEEKWTLLNTGRITSRYGNRELNGVMGFHAGIDIAGNFGDDVYAIAEGVVSACGVDEGYGNYIKIMHPTRGIMTLYGHLQSIGIQEGEPVVRGSVIGTVGSTGKSSGPHLHLEVRDAENHTLDPAPYIAY